MPDGFQRLTRNNSVKGIDLDEDKLKDVKDKIPEKAESSKKGEKEEKKGNSGQPPQGGMSPTIDFQGSYYPK